jgi:hypothetical protein
VAELHGPVRLPERQADVLEPVIPLSKQAISSSLMIVPSSVTTRKRI